MKSLPPVGRIARLEKSTAVFNKALSFKKVLSFETR
jgi:hypothetical protein